jgi:hypothetical protein
MTSEYSAQWCYCVGCWCGFGWRPCERIWASKKAS